MRDSRFRARGSPQHTTDYETNTTTQSAPAWETSTRSQGVHARANSRTTAMPTKLLTNREDPPEADLHKSRRSRPAAFLRPESSEPYARDSDIIPDWHRPPTNWREEYDVIVGAQLRGLTRPGAPTADNPCALRLRLPSEDLAARPVPARTTHHDGAWTRRPYLFLPNASGNGWKILLQNSSRQVGTLTEAGGRLEIRRTDHWSTLLAIVPGPDGRQLLEPPLLGLSLGAAAVVFSAHWPAGPPAVRLPDEYRRPRKKRS